MLEAGRRWLDHGDYAVSRVPGAAIHEVSTAFLDDVGGSVLVNVASVLFAGLALWGLQDLLRREGSRISGLAVLVLATNPWFWIAATSLGDFAWALGLLLAGAVAARRDHRVLAGVLFALAIGCRLSTVFLVVAWLVAEQLGDRRTRAPVRSTIITGARRARRSARCASCRRGCRRIARSTSSRATSELRGPAGPPRPVGDQERGVLRRAGRRRAGVRPAATAPCLAVVAHVDRRSASLSWPSPPPRSCTSASRSSRCTSSPPPWRWRSSIGHFGTEARRWIGVLIAAQLIGGLVTTTLAAPDVEDRASSGEIELGLTAGPLLTDVRCRLDDRDDGPYEDGTSEESTQRAAQERRLPAGDLARLPLATPGLIGDGTKDVEEVRSGPVAAGRVTLCVALALGLVACSDDPEDSTPSTEETSSSSTTTTAPERPASTTTTAFDPASVEGEVEAAYLKSWDVYADAVYDLVLDEEALAEVYAEEHLETKRRRSSDVLHEGRASLVRRRPRLHG